MSMPCLCLSKDVYLYIHVDISIATDGVSSSRLPLSRPEAQPLALDPAWASKLLGSSLDPDDQAGAGGVEGVVTERITNNGYAWI